MDKAIEQRVISANSVFGRYFIDCQALYMYCFTSIPSISYVDDIEGETAFDAFREQYKDHISSVHTYRWIRRKDKDVEFDDTVVILHDRCVLEFGEGYCKILHNEERKEFTSGLISYLRGFKEKQRRKPLEINLIVKSGNYLELKAMEIKRTKLDLRLFYEDDFKAVDENIRKRLNQKDDKGIVLLHGLPGSGKTTYLRYLVGRIKKKVLFLSPNIACSLTDPDFIDLLIDNPNSVVIIEDAENVIMDRRSNPQSSVSNLLNISDGLLSDFLNVQLVCTFNSSVAMIDQALMRKGRLIARYEFGKLSIQKSQQLSNHLGFDNVINQPKTIAEIANPHEEAYQSPQVQVIGFRRAVIEN
ncbi:AAA family ATPase [Paraflavitalea sp. CAU 1676]|uniref:AAA family ATPase n=1 Tax=Paraflavitalea sp. CAU 1676 TaxID=3032598 RepID=UPI0023DC41DC|nr:AAA family ATPase [Paraflavitalea sp. CAU 1676]MDF2187044.1 AAA family ATPase [Paraflavitalea sp. CAU 1676]